MAAGAAPTVGPLAGRTADFTCHAAPVPGKVTHMVSRVPFRGAGKVTVKATGVVRTCTVIGCKTTKDKVFVHSYV